MLPSRGGGCTVVWGPSFSHGRGPPISQSRAAAGIARLSANLSLRRGFTPKELPNIWIRCSCCRMFCWTPHPWHGLSGSACDTALSVGCWVRYRALEVSKEPQPCWVLPRYSVMARVRTLYTAFELFNYICFKLGHFWSVHRLTVRVQSSSDYGLVELSVSFWWKSYSKAGMFRSRAADCTVKHLVQ